MKKFYAEGIGTFIFVFAGTGAFVVGGQTLGTIGIALAFGLAYAAAALALGPLAGAQLNPAVTVAFALAGRVRAREVLPTVLAQVAGATLGLGLAVVIARSRPGGAPLVYDTLASGFGRHSPGFYGLNAALVSEIGLGAVLAFVLLGASPRRPSEGHVMTALAGGVAVSLVHLVGLPVTGLPVHPGRALAAALLSPELRLGELWVFVFGPLVGGALAALAFRAVSSPLASGAEAASHHR